MRRVSALLAFTLLSACANTGGNDEITRKYVLFFTKDSTRIAPAGDAVLAQVAAVAGRHPDLNLVVAGYAAAHGNIDADQALSEGRAHTVSAALQADGVPAGRIAEHARAPANEDPAVAARRVEIAFAPQS